MSAAKEIGRSANDRGRRSEANVLEAISAGPLPKWVLSVRKATREEDARGIDLVVETDVGKLFLQVKSSRAGVLHHRLRARFERPLRWVAAIVGSGIRDVVRDRAVSALAQLREDVLRLREERAS